jgi:hypothetical protein
MCGVSARESVSGGRGRGCWIGDVLMFCLGNVLLPRVDRQNPGSWISKRQQNREGSHVF